MIILSSIRQSMVQWWTAIEKSQWHYIETDSPEKPTVPRFILTHHYVETKIISRDFPGFNSISREFHAIYRGFRPIYRYRGIY